jgi:hypothetical protein
VSHSFTCKMGRMRVHASFASHGETTEALPFELHMSCVKCGKTNIFDDCVQALWDFYCRCDRACSTC